MTAFLYALVNVQNEDYSFCFGKKHAYGGKLVPSILIFALGVFVPHMNSILPFFKRCSLLKNVLHYFIGTNQNQQNYGC